MQNTLYILWTNDNLDTTRHMVMMYATNAKLRGWWQEVKVIIWGATAKLVAHNGEVQRYMELARRAGVSFSACISCAQELGVTKELEALAIEMIPWGEPLTQLLKNNEKLLTT